MQHYLVTFAWQCPRTGRRLPFRTLESEPGYDMRDVIGLIEEGTKDACDKDPAFIRVICADLETGMARDVTDDALHHFFQATGAEWSAPARFAAE